MTTRPVASASPRRAARAPWYRALRVLLEKEFLQIRRDVVILRMLFVMPLVQLVVLANAATFEVTRAALWVVDQDGTPDARALVERFVASGRFAVAGRSASAVPADAALLNNRATIVLAIPPRFASDIARDRRATVQLVLNAVNGSQAGITQGYAQEILARYAAERSAELSARVGSAARALPPPTMQVRTRGWFNVQLDYQLFMVPGVLVQLVTIVGTLMTALNIVREKEAGTLDQLNVTPLRPAVFIAAKLIPLWVIGLVEFSAGLLIATLLFHVPIVGSVLLLYGGAMLFLLAALGVGLWISTITHTQQQALFVTFSMLMVYILMSGLFTPVRGMPDVVRWAAQINPLLHFIALMRAVMLRGAGLTDVWTHLVGLAVIGAAILSLAVGQYRKQTQ